MKSVQRVIFTIISIIIFTLGILSYIMQYKTEIKYWILEKVSLNAKRGIIPAKNLIWCNFPNPQPPAPYGVPDSVMDITHPSVVYIKNRFNGHSIWAAASPYPQSLPLGGEYYENSCIYFSDYKSSAPPTEFAPIKNNPIITPQDISYNSDPDIFYDSIFNKLYCITRQKYGKNFATSIVLQSSNDGSIWSEPVTVITDKINQGELSPSLFEKDGMYYILAFQKDSLNKKLVKRADIWISKSLENPDFKFFKSSKLTGGVNVWHGDIFSHNGEIYAIVCGTGLNFKYMFQKTDVSKYLFIGKMDSLFNIKFSDIPLIKNNGVYRSTAFVDENENLVIYVSYHYRYLKDKTKYKSGHRIACVSYPFKTILDKT